jgi:uncharacterized damage-inducible protein DinB
MNMNRPLVDTLKFNDYILNIATGDLQDSFAKRRLRSDGGPSIAWTIGHGLHHRLQMAGLIGCELPLNGLDCEPFGRPGATDGAEYPALRELLTAWTNSSSVLIPAMEAVSDADLINERSGLPLPHGEKRLLDALVFYVWHETYHLGHIGVLRSHLGLTPIVNLVLSASASASAPATTAEPSPVGA